MLTDLEQELLQGLLEAKVHLDYCGYGDEWERECAGDLPERLDILIVKAENEKNKQ
jgi:hypothetical protein